MSRNRINDLLDELSKKSGISELIINNHDHIYVEKDGELIRIDTKFSDDEINGFCQSVAVFNRKDFDSMNPLLDGNLPDGSRINLVHKDYTGGTHAITIRKFQKNIKSFDSSPGIFGLNDEWVEFFKAVVRARMNVVVSGGTGVGKTTFLNLLLQEIPHKERIISIEDTRELSLNQPNVIRLESRPEGQGQAGLTVRELLKNTLRMRPDRIIVGEVRGGEVFDLLQAMNTGHEGSMTSVHANSPSETLIRLENLYLLSGHDIPLKALRYQISSAVDFIVQLKRDKDGKRLVHQVAEVVQMEGERILLQDLGTVKGGLFDFNGLVPSRFAKLQKVGLPQNFFAGT